VNGDIPADSHVRGALNCWWFLWSPRDGDPLALEGKLNSKWALRNEDEDGDAEGLRLGLRLRLGLGAGLGGAGGRGASHAPLNVGEYASTGLMRTRRDEDGWLFLCFILQWVSLKNCWWSLWSPRDGPSINSGRAIPWLWRNRALRDEDEDEDEDEDKGERGDGGEAVLTSTMLSRACTRR
jgi:hypothetical protein